MLAAMAGRSPARFLAPLALVAVVVALVHGRWRRRHGDGDRASPPATQPTATATRHSKKRQAQAQGLRGQARRHPVGDRGEDRRLAEQLEEPNPTLDPQPLAAGPADQAARSDPRRRRARARGVVALLGCRRPRRAAGRRPASSSRPARSSIEASTGDVACARDADERRSIASTTKLMTALLTLERAELSDRSPPSRYFAGPAESRDRPAAGRADDGARPAARPAGRVGQRRRGHARRGRRAARARRSCGR